MGCRKDHRDLTPAERTRFVEALYHVKASGLVDQFASDHSTFFHEAHHSSHFLPWHREFLRRFEDALRSYDPDISLPYWNSTEDTDVNSSLWDNSFLGQFDSAWGLGRSLGSDTLPPPGNVTTALDQGSYGALWPYLESDEIHNPPHRWVSGVMGSVSSPLDPVFYLHHCWVDMLWAQWQLQNPGAAFEESESGRGLNDAMAPWSTTPADVLDHRTIGMYHYLAGMQPDAPLVSRDPPPTISFIEVPEGETRLQAAVFSLDACEPVHLNVVDGPTVTSGPPETQFEMVAGSVTADPRVDSKARLWIRFTGTSDGDTATGTVVVRCEETGEEFEIPLTANTIARPTAAAVMVLDRSNSMNFDSGIGPGVTRADVLRFSASPVIAVVDDVHALAVCHFDHDAHPGIGMTPVGGGGAVLLNGAITGYAPNPDGWTSIGEGVAFAHSILDPVTGYDVKAMVVLSDGAENHGPHNRRSINDVADLISGLNGHVFAIGLGRPEVLNAAALQTLCNGNDGYMVMTGDLTADASFRLAKYYQQIFAGVTNNEVVLDPDGTILPGALHRIPFWLNETDINAKAILLTPAPWALTFALETPQGDIIDAAGAAAHPMAELSVGSQVALYRVGLPIPLGANEAHAGQWHVLLKVTEKMPGGMTHTHGFDNGLPGSFAVHGLPYSVNIHAYSNLRMKAVLAQNSYEPGATLTVRALLTEYGVPLPGPAQCRAEVVRPDGSEAVLPMPQVEPGIFEATTLAAMPGVYRLRILAEGRTMRGRPFTREQTRTAGVWRGGDQPPTGGTNEPSRPDDRLCKLLRCLLRQKGVQEKLRRAGIDLDELRHCLEEYCRGDRPEKGRTRADLRQNLKAVLGDERLLDTLIGALERERS